MDFDDITRFFLIFAGVSVVLLGLWLVNYHMQQHSLELTLQQEHVRYHQEHKDAFSKYCARCGRSSYNKHDINLAERESDSDV